MHTHTETSAPAKRRAVRRPRKAKVQSTALVPLYNPRHLPVVIPQEPTLKIAEELTAAFRHFNRALWGGQLPEVAIVLNVDCRCYGYFAPDALSDGKIKRHEIGLNPLFIGATRDQKSPLSTLVHEMAHLWQATFGKNRRPKTHDREWAEEMKRIGLHPSTTGLIGGDETGKNCSHYIIGGGLFDLACEALLKTGFRLTYGSTYEIKETPKGPVIPGFSGKIIIPGWGTVTGVKPAKRNVRAKHVCPCCRTQAYAGRSAQIACVPCSEKAGRFIRFEIEGD